MKKTFKRLVTLLLVAVMCFSSVSGVSAKVVIEDPDWDDYQLDLGFEVIDYIPPATPGAAASGFNPTKLITGPIKMLASRAWQELAAYSIANDVPGLSTFFKFLRTPAQRATAAQREMITQIVNDIAEIKVSVAHIEEQLKELADIVNKNDTEAAYNSAANNFNDVAKKYSAAWLAYEAMLLYTESLAKTQENLTNAEAQLETITASKATLEARKAGLEAELALETDETKKAETQAKITSCEADIATVTENIDKANKTIASLKDDVQNTNKSIDEAIGRFISICEEGGGLNFSSDLSLILGYIWNTDNPTASYLGAYEAFLRERYAFEHEITESLKQAYETCVDTVIQMLTIYTEYYTYKRNVETENNSDSDKSNDSNKYQSYTEDYFATINEKIIKNFDVIARASGFDELMITKDYTEDEIKEFRENDPDFVVPENINQSVVIDGVTYECYKVRDNKDLLYYLILKPCVSNKTLVSKLAPDYATSGGMIVLDYYKKAVYRPTMMLDNVYTDDGRYQMISASALPDFITDASRIRTSLRSVSGLTEIPQDSAYIMLYHNECVNLEEYYFNGDIYWNMKLLSVEGAGDADPETVSSKSVYDDSKYAKTLVIYREVNTDDYYGSDGVWEVIDSGEISNSTITVNDGQTLDLTNISVDIENVNIHIIGGGTIISNPDITLKNSHIFISSDTKVTIQDLNVKGRNYDTAVVEVVKKNNESIVFKGTNTFTASAEQLTGLDIYEQCEEGMPIAASSGMYIAVGADVTICCEDATFVGAAGGAGICSDTTVTIKGEGTTAKLTAKGSYLSNLEDGLENYYVPRAVGAGIGVSFSGVDYVHDGIDLSYTYAAIGTKGQINLKALNVDASGSNANSDNKLYSEDIGGVYTAGGDFSISGGSIKESTVKTANQRISSKITYKDSTNAFVPDVYKITADTKGSNGVTNKGISINIIGEKGESGWIKASDIGNDKGSTTQSVAGNSVGKITAIKVKTNDSNSWYPGKITVSAQYSGESITVYGGRWIGTSEKTLSPSDNVYELTVNTGTASGAGTDADISVFLQDNDGTKTSTICLSDIHQDANAFENGDSDTFPIYAPSDFGECRHIFLSSDHSNSAAGWLVDKLTVKKVQGSGSDSGYSVDTNYWFEYAKTVNFGKYSGKTGAYYIEVKTGNKSGAGTDSDIYLTLHGDAYSKNTEEINMSDMAGDGNDFEKNNLDCFYVGFNTNAIGDLKSITIRKANNGLGPDWYLDYIKITEEIGDGQTGKTYTINVGKWIENSSYTFNVSSTGTARQSISSIDRDILEGLEQDEDGSYTLTVDRNINLTEQAFALLQETGKKLTVIMTDDDKPIYSLTFDGTKITDYQSMNLSKEYSFADGNAILDVLAGVSFPAGTTMRLYTKNIGFLDGDKLVVLSKDENGNWAETATLESADGIVEISLGEAKDLLISKFGAALPTGEAEADPERSPQTGDSIAVYVITLTLALTLMAAVVILGNSKRRRFIG